MKRYELNCDTMLINENDERFDEYKKIKGETGISPDELWGLDCSISIFILPRLKMFKEYNKCYPMGMTKEGWDNIIDKMIWSFQAVLDENELGGEEMDERWYNKKKDGLELFAKHLSNLWW